MSRVAWYYAEEGVTHGPVAWDALIAAVQEGKLTPTGGVWTPGIDEWVSSESVPWLFHSPEVPATLTETQPSLNAGLVGGLDGVVSPPPLKVWSWKLNSGSPIRRFGLLRVPLLKRMLASLIDLLTSGLLGWISGQVVVTVMRVAGFTNDDATRSTGAGVMIACMLLYHVAFESMRGTTPGKRAMHGRLVDINGNPPFATRIVARVVLRFILLLWIVGGSVAFLDGYLSGNVANWSTNEVVVFAITVVLLLFSMVRGERRPLHDVLSGCWLVQEPPKSRKGDVP